MASSYSKSKGRSQIRSFAGIPRVVMESADYLGLGGNAIRLLLELAYQYKGKNNGDLCAAYSVMRKRGFKSKQTLANALKQLLDANLIEKTREGVFMNPGGRCALYALTWVPRDECDGKHDLKATSNPIRKFSMENQNTRYTNRTKVAPISVPSNQQSGSICH